MANDVVFVNPGWISAIGGTTVYFTQSSVYEDSGHGGTVANCYSTFKEAYDDASSAATIYVYNDSANSLSLAAPSGAYSQLLSSAFFIEKNLYVRAYIFQVGSVEHSTYSFNIDGPYTVDFGVTESFNIAQNTSFVVSYGANFQLGSTGSGTSVSLENSGTVSVTTGIGEEAAPSNFYAGNTSITNTGEIEVIGSAFSVASVTNNIQGERRGTFTVKGTSKLNIDTLDGTITLAVIPANDNNPAVNPTLNASSITGGGTNSGTLTAQGDLTFTGDNTLRNISLNATVTGKTVTVGNTASLTVGGMSTLNIGTLSGTILTDSEAATTLRDSSITGGSISAQDDLTFTGANTLNGISLDAMVANKTVTVGTGNSDSLTVGGTSTLNIGTLDGEIKTAASTTLQNSNITGGGTNGGTITAQGAIRVNNSTITSSTFTAITVNGVDFYGENTLDGVTLETGTSTNDGYVYIDTDGGTLTIKGKSTLKTLGLLGTRTIKLVGAEIVDSKILGNNGAGGTLVVESGKTATFSTTGSNSNDFGKTSFNNSGTINVNGLLSLSTTTGTISNSGTINVNGRLTTGATNNTNGTIALNGGATVTSNITGGSITTSNTGTVTVDDSTISSSAFTATADEVIFYYRNTLNGVTLDATGKTVTVNGTLTVKGTSTLNATNITGGTISAQDNLTFTGTNTLNDGVTLDATGTTTTVTIGNDDEIADSLTVEGTNTLNIGTLNGTIKTDADALTTLNASSITGGGISAQDDLTFTGANTLNGISLDAMVANKTVTVGTGNSDSLTVGGTSTLKIGTLNGEIKTGSAGTTLTGSTITGGGTNGGTITALGNLTFANKTHLRNITLDALDQTVDTGSSYSLWLGGAITLKIGNLISSIQLNEDTTFTNSTISNGNESSRLYIYGGKVVTFAGANTIFDAKVHATGRITNDGSITVESKNNVKGELTVYRIENSGSITVGSAGSANEAADACSLTGTLLNNGGTITVIGGDNQSNRSLLDAAYITNGNNSGNTGKMSLTNAVLNATTLTNYGRGEFDPGPRTSQAAITISNSTVSLVKDGTGALTNGATDNTSATIEFNNSTVTADSVTNYGIDNGTSGNTGRVGFAMTDSTFTVNNTFTNHGWIYVNNSTLQATSLVNNGDRFYVYGTSTLNIGTLTGRIDIINGNDKESLLTLNNSHITGKVNDDGSLVSSIYVSNPLTFTGTNTLTNTRFYAPYAAKTVTVDSGATLTVGGTSTLDIASLDGTILTDSAATTTLKGSSITNGTITAQNNLAFTGVNTLNRVTLNAADRTVTVGTGNFDSLTVGGTSSSLNIGTLDGTIKTGSAGTTLNASSITGGGTNGGTITVQGDLTFTGANTLNSVTLSAAGQAVTVGSGATLTVGGTSTLNIGTLYGTITVADGATLSNSTVGGTVKVQSDATLTLDGVNAITTLDLSATDAAVTMDWQDQLSFTGFNGDYEGKLTINLNNYSPGDLSTPILHYAGDGEWTRDQAIALYHALLKNDWSTDQYVFVVDDYGDLYIDLQEIVVDNRVYDTTTVLNGVPAIIEDGQFTTKAVIGGQKVTDTTGDPISEHKSISLTVGDGTIANPGGEFSNLLSAGDCVVSGDFHRYAPTDPVSGEYTAPASVLTINGGVFSNDVACGMVYMGSDATSQAWIHGDTDFVINGGTFEGYVYGGCTANRSVNSGCSHIDGSVFITVNATNDISMNKLVVGSYKNGKISGDTHLTLTGNGEKLIFDPSSGEIWGACSGDYYSITNNGATRTFVKNGVQGNRILTFSGFSGALNCTKIRGFNQAEFKDGTEVTLNNGGVYNFSDIEQWTFEYDSKITASNFANSFLGDELILTGIDNLSKDWTIMENSRGADAFAGFGGNAGDMTVKFYLNADDTTGTSMAWDTDGYYDAGSNYKLALNSTSTGMIFSYIG